MVDLGELTDVDFIIPPKKFEFLESSEYVAVRACGETLIETFEQCAIGIVDFMIDVDKVEIKNIHFIETVGENLQTSLFFFLSKLLDLCVKAPMFAVKKVTIINIALSDFKIQAKILGEPFVLTKHNKYGCINPVTHLNVLPFRHVPGNVTEIYIVVKNKVLS